MIYSYKNHIYPDYLKHGNACQYIQPIAKQFCHGNGIDVGCGDWPLDGAIAHDVKGGGIGNFCGDAYDLPDGPFDYVFSSHCLEHLGDPIGAIEHWKSRLIAGGVLFLYLPHEEMEYWLPQNNRKHLHTWQPLQMAKLLEDLGFIDVMHSERDLAWSFAVVGFNGNT